MSWNRYTPYDEARTNQRSPQLSFWSGAYQSTHPSKPFQDNNDYYFSMERSLGVFDGVGGVREISLDPSAMALDLNMRVPDALQLRLQHNAQMFDRDIQAMLATTIEAKCGGWLRNLIAYVFMKTTCLGSTTLGCCQLTGRQLSTCVMGL